MTLQYNKTNMKKTTTLLVFIAVTGFFLSSCGAGAKDKKGDIGDMSWMQISVNWKMILPRPIPKLLNL